MNERIIQLRRVAKAVLFILLLSIAGLTKAQTENITFADAIVKAYCVANWDTDGDGELNQAEAAAVTSLDGVFMFDDGITSFNELQFFVGLASIGEDEFNSCTSLAAISIPSAVNSIGNYAFSDCSSLTSMTSYACTPPALGNDVFYNVPSIVVLNVPCHTSAMYQEADGWSDFSNYGEFEYGLCPIPFADATVKAICIAHWDTNEDGELSYAEAAAVTNLGTYFKSTAITSFDELEYFTSLTSLPNTAFYGCTSLASITLPTLVSALGNGSFYNCTSLATMTVYAETPPTVGTNALKNVPIEMVVYVPCGTYAAYHTVNGWSEFTILQQSGSCPIVFADANVKALCVASWDTNSDGELSYDEAAAVTDLGEVFKYKNNIISFDELQYFTGLTYINSQAFYNCSNLTSIEIPNSVTLIGDYAFYNCSNLTSIEIPNSVTLIGDYAFNNCSGLTSIEIPSSVASIGNSAFNNCSGLTSVEIPGSVTSIGTNSFSSCNGLEQIVVASDNAYYDSRENCNAIIRTSNNALVTGCKNTMIPNSVTSIGSYAFYNCSSFTGSLTIPNSVTSIESYAFSYCSGFTGSLTIPNSVTSIGSYAFSYCSGFTGSLTIPNSVTSIGYGAFYSCSGLTSVEIPSSVTSIGTYSFSSCNGLEQIVVASDNAYYDSRENCNAIIRTSNNALVTGCKNAVIPNSVTSIDNSAFYNCRGLTSVEIPSSVTLIGNYAFYYCNGLTSVEMPSSVTAIGEFAFYNCSSLTSIEIPSSMTSIGNYAFSGCSGLSSITVNTGTPPTIYYNTFSNVNKTILVYVPCNSITTFQSALYWKDFINYLPATECDPGEITVTINPAEGGTVMGTGYYEGSTTCTLTATANTGYTFRCWMEDDQLISRNATYSFIVTGDRNFVAVFEPYYAISTSVNPNGGGTIYYDKIFDFENGFDGWTTIDADHDGWNWSLASSVFDGVEGFGQNSSDDFLVSQSYVNFYPHPLNPDNYLVSPLIELGCSICFWARAQDSDWAGDHFGVAVSTTSNTDASAFTTIQEWTMTAKGVEVPADVNHRGNRAFGNWYQYTVDLSAYEGQTGYVAIRHFNSYDLWCLNVDDITISRYSINGREYYQGQRCFVTAVPNNGCDFLNWTENGEVVSTDAEYSFTVTGNRNLVANFTTPPPMPVIAEYYPDSNEPNSPYVKVHWAATSFEAQIGEGSSTFGYFPFYTLYNYSISENLFLASELEEAGVNTATMTSLSWYATNAPGYEQQGISIWMANVSDTELTTTSHTVSGMTLVYTGTVTPEIGWNEFVFNEGTFVWDGVSNVLILCQRNNGVWNSTVYWQSQNVGFNASSYRYQDSEPYNVNIANTVYNSNQRPNIIMKGEGAMTYNLYRANCDDSNTQLIAENLNDTQYIDETWWQLENDSYKYGVSIADSTNTDIFWSNCIENNFIPTAFHFITPGNWSNAANWQYGALPGVYDIVFIDADCQLDMTTEVAELTVSNGQSLTLQPDKTLTVTGNLTNTSTTGLVIKDGAQLINASGNVAATLEKDITAYSDSNPEAWYTIASPMYEMPIEGSSFATPEFDLYRYNESNLTNEEWENYKGSLADFTIFENGRGYLFANSNAFSPAFTGTLNASAVSCPLSYTERPNDPLSGFHLIGNPFPHDIYKGEGAAIDDANLVSGYYTLTNEGTWQVHTFEDAIHPGQGILVKATAPTILTIAKSTAVATSETGGAKRETSPLSISVKGENGQDQAFVYFGRGNSMEKMGDFVAQEPSLWVRDNGKDYAIAHMEKACETLELCFSSKQEGDFTLAIDRNETEFEYLQLVDHVTGLSVDLLKQPTYGFHATGQEPDARFSIRFKVAE